MQFVHKYHDYRLQVFRGYEEYRKGSNGVDIAVTTTEPLEAVFTRRQLPIRGNYGPVSAETVAYVWREIAMQFFDGKDTSRHAHEPHGAYRHDGITTSTDDDDTNVFFSGSHRENFYGVFDTEDETDCEPQWREVYEAVLTGDEDACARLSEKYGFLGRDRLRISPDLRTGEMLVLDKLLDGGYGEFIVNTPDGPFVTGMGLTRAQHTPVREAVRVNEQPAPAFPSNFPWKGYDDISGNHLKVAKQIVDTVQLINLEPPKVLAYELEHKNRPSVVKRLTELVNEQQGEPVAPEPVVAEDTPDESEALQREMVANIP